MRPWEVGKDGAAPLLPQGPQLCSFVWSFLFAVPWIDRVASRGSRAPQNLISRSIFTPPSADLHLLPFSVLGTPLILESYPAENNRRHKPNPCPKTLPKAPDPSRWVDKISLSFFWRNVCSLLTRQWRCCEFIPLNAGNCFHESTYFDYFL